MSCQPSATRARGREEAAAKHRRPKARKVSAKQQKTATKSVIDLTTPEEEEEESDDKEKNQMEAHLESDDYFEVLDLPRSASGADVKRAYRKLAVQWHPDKNRSHPRAEEFFKKISEAYEVLGDPEKRPRYEKYGKAGLDGRAASPHGDDEHFAFSGRAGFSAQHARDIFDAFFGGQDPFEAFFGRGRQRRGSSQRRFGDDQFQAMAFGGMGMGVRGFGNMGGMSMMDSFFTDGFGGLNGSAGAMFSTSTSSSSSTFTDRNGHVVTQKTTTTTGADGRTDTVTEEYRNGQLVNSTSSSSATGSRLADAGRMQLEGRTSQGTTNSSHNYQRRGSNNSRH
ncbi:hypothetical protein PHYPSEUDO_009364 [Phytophthora pseudosyringae]|uniref:J domain-containing protein n=1 Tax=Phytophthora pseudosyringae TaxID=221518 RepID=A0A8T1W9A6_9STRA|nr:hypothetical protein PHYPSEUDO_009364 [Phytophthora pseudosyringae]